MRSCIDCKFHQTVTRPDKEFMTVCRKEPPRMATQAVQTPNGVVWLNNVLWPIVSKEDWCGAHESDQEHGRPIAKLGVIAS